MRTEKIRSRTDMKLLKDDKAVSPVIAVILMVAITVVMAAIVSSWSAGVKAPTTPTTVGLDIARDNDTITVVVTAIDPASAAPIPAINITYNNGTTQYSTITDANVGDTRTVDTDNTATQQIIITATFKDASKKVLYSREV